eukprot:765185-Hanusia_phi.AAC.1
MSKTLPPLLPRADDFSCSSHGGMRIVAIAADGSRGVSPGPARRSGLIKTGMLVVGTARGAGVRANLRRVMQNVIDGTAVADLTEDEERCPAGERPALTAGPTGCEEDAGSRRIEVEPQPRRRGHSAFCP